MAYLVMPDGSVRCDTPAEVLALLAARTAPRCDRDSLEAALRAHPQHVFQLGALAATFGVPERELRGLFRLLVNRGVAVPRGPGAYQLGPPRVLPGRLRSLVVGALGAGPRTLGELHATLGGNRGALRTTCNRMVRAGELGREGPAYLKATP